MAPFTSTLTSRYLAGGLVILGKTSTPEFGMASVTEPAVHGVTNNPWDPHITAGGSSGGSASAVAAGMVPAAHASDGGGSIRIPSAACGLVGLKPTRGRNPVGPIVGEGWYGLAASHVVTRTVRDSAALLDLSHGPEPGDPYAATPPEGSFLEAVAAAPRRLRIGVVEGAVTGDVTLSPECTEAVGQTASLLEELGHTVEPVSTEIGPGQGRRAMLVLSSVDTAWMVETFHVDQALLEPANQVVVRAGKEISATEFAANLFLVRSYGRQIGQIMERHDVLITSTLGTPPWPHRILQPDAEQTERITALLEGRSRGPAFELVEDVAIRNMDRIPNTWLFNMTGQTGHEPSGPPNRVGTPGGDPTGGTIGEGGRPVQSGRSTGVGPALGPSLHRSGQSSVGGSGCAAVVFGTCRGSTGVDTSHWDSRPHWSPTGAGETQEKLPAGQWNMCSPSTLRCSWTRLTPRTTSIFRWFVPRFNSPRVGKSLLPGRAPRST